MPTTSTDRTVLADLLALDPLVLPDIGDVSVKAADNPVICFVDEDIMEASLAAFNGKPHIERMADNGSGNWILV